MGAQAREEAAPRHRAPPPAGAAAPEQALHKAAGALRPPPPCIGASRAPDLARVMGLFLGVCRSSARCAARSGRAPRLRPAAPPAALGGERAAPRSDSCPSVSLWVGRGRHPGVTPAPQSLSAALRLPGVHPGRCRLRLAVSFPLASKLTDVVRLLAPARDGAAGGCGLQAGPGWASRGREGQHRSGLSWGPPAF